MSEQTHEAILIWKQINAVIFYLSVLEVGQLQNEGKRILRFPGRKSPREVNHPNWLTDSVELDFNAWIAETLQELNDSISIAVVFYKNFSAFLPQRFLAQYGDLDIEYRLHSRIVAVAMETGRKQFGGKSGSLKVKARLAHLDHTVNHQIMWNISCGIANFSQGNVEFSMDGCQPVQTGNFSLCQCSHVGTYAVLLTSYAQSGDLQYQGKFEVIAGIGCAVCAFFVCLTFFILIVLWRKIRGAITALKIQVCTALIGAYVTILKALHEPPNKESFPCAVSLIQFFVLSAFSLQLCLALTVHTECADTTRGVTQPELKLAALGWAIPMIVVGATLAAQVPEGFQLNSWWIEIHTNYFYAFSISVIIITLLQIMLVTTIKTELKIHKKLEAIKYAKTVNRIGLLNRSLVIVLFLLIASVSSIMFINFEDDVFKYAFSASSGALGLIIFLCYTIYSENAISLCSSEISIEEDDDDDKQERRLKNRNGSFQGFLKPEIVSDTYCGTKLPDAFGVDADKLRQLRFRIGPGDIGWSSKEADDLLLSRDKSHFTVHHHHQMSPAVVFAKQRLPADDPKSPEFLLQQLDDSPGSSHLHGDTESKFCDPPPDILDKAYFPAVTSVPVVGDVTVDRKATSYSTFRPDNTATFTGAEEMQVQLKDPDIGDEPMVAQETGTLKKMKEKVLGLRVPSPPVVPPVEQEASSGAQQSKKAWSITTV